MQQRKKIIVGLMHMIKMSNYFFNYLFSMYLQEIWRSDII